MGIFDQFRDKSWENRVEQKLDDITRRIIKVSAQEQALDAALGNLATTVDGLKVTVDAVLAKLSNVPESVDLSDETAALEGLSASLGQAKDALDAATNPEPPPAP